MKITRLHIICPHTRPATRTNENPEFHLARASHYLISATIRRVIVSVHLSLAGSAPAHSALWREGTQLVFETAQLGDN